MRQLRVCGVAVAAVVLLAPARAAAQADYKVLATNKTSTMQKEMQEAAAAGYRFVDVMGGETAFGGNEVVVVMGRFPDAGARRYEYRLLATSKTSTMQKELQEASDAGFEFKAQTVFKSTFGGKEVAAILERDPEVAVAKWEYLLLATKKTSTMQKEIAEAAEQGYQVVALAVGQTLIGGNELVTIMRKARG